MLVVSLCKPVIRKLKILGGGKLGYYRSMGGTTKRRGEPNFEISVGERKRGNTLFDSNLAGGILEETMDSNTKPLLTSKVRKRKVNNIDHSLSTYAKFSEKLSSLTPWLYMKVRSSISKSAVTSNHPEILYFAKWKIKNWSFLFRSSEKPTPNEVEEAVLSCEFVIRLENSWYFFKHLIHCFFFRDNVDYECQLNVISLFHERYLQVPPMQISLRGAGSYDEATKLSFWKSDSNRIILIYPLLPKIVWQ